MFDTPQAAKPAKILIEMYLSLGVKAELFIRASRASGGVIRLR
jgi:hypothetical protein